MSARRLALRAHPWVWRWSGRTTAGATRRRRLVVLAAIVTALTNAVLPGASAARAASGLPALAHPAATSDPSAAVVIVLDTSGSMADADSKGLVKIDAAETAALNIVSTAGYTGQFGLITYPGSTRKDESGECFDGTLRVPLGTVDVDYASTEIRKMSPEGDTPTSAALRMAARTLKTKGFGGGTIVLVSDGLANCGPPPCETARSLRSEGFNVVINTISLDMREQQGTDDLQCIARETGGSSYSVDDAGKLADEIQRAAQPRLELTHTIPSTVRPVVGAAEATYADLSGTRVRVTLTNSASSTTGSDVRVALTFTPKDTPRGAEGVVDVVPPQRYLGNVRAGQSREMVFVIRAQPGAGTLHWTLTAISSNGPPTRVEGDMAVDDSMSSAALGPVLKDAKRVVVLGDSYSSGEGGPPYVSGTFGADGKNWCHRTDATYAHRIWGKATTLYACSGAITPNFAGWQASGSGRVTPQREALEDFVREQPPDAVLLTFGGNDVGFSSIVESCVLGPAAQRGPNCGNEDLDTGDETSGPLGHSGREGRMLRAREIAWTLLRLYESVDAIVNGEEAVAKRGGRVAPIVVLPYVRIVPQGLTPGAQTAGCLLLISPEEVAFFNDFLNQLNLSVKDAVAAAAQGRNGARPIYYAGDVVEAIQPGHTVCADSASYAVKVSKEDIATVALTDVKHLLDAIAAYFRPGLRDDGGAFADVANDVWDAVKALQNKDELLQQLVHPNRSGHEAMARALVAWSQQAVPVHAGVAPRPLLDWSAPVGSAEERLSATAAAVGAPTGAGDATPLNIGGFAPGADTTIWLESTPVVVGGARAGEDGWVRTWVRIPGTTAPGDHHLVAEGPDPSGGYRSAGVAITIAPEGARVAYLAGLGGLLLLAATLAMSVMLRRRARL